MSPVILPSFSTSALSMSASPNIARELPNNPIHGIIDRISPSSPANPVRRSTEGPVGVFREEGLRRADVAFDARKYKQLAFASQLLDCLRQLRVPTWSAPEITPHSLVVRRVSGSLTNAIFFVSCTALLGVRTVLLRIYGSSSGNLISRPQEILTLHFLSSQHRIGARIYGTFTNGRVEEYFESTTLSASDIRDPEISRWIGARMAELHSVDLHTIEKITTGTHNKGNGWNIGVRQNVRSWLTSAESVLALPSISNALRAELDLPKFKTEWARYMKWIATVNDVNAGSRRVFAHNDTQYGNLLRLKNPTSGMDDHHQIIVVDFEYGGPNPASFDIANHFHEWTTDYHSDTPHIYDPSRYPNPKERRNFYLAYLRHCTIFGPTPVVDKTELERQVVKLDQQVCIWSPASHAMWAIWGIVQAREDIDAGVAEPDFNYMEYARGRMASFRRDLHEFGV